MRSSFGRDLLCGLAMGGLALLGASSSASASVMFNGIAYSQNFDSLPISPENVSLQPAQKWQDDTTAVPGSIISIPGWYLYHALDPGVAEDGTNGHQRFRITSGGTGTGSFYSFGSTGNSDRALGDIGSTTIAQNPGVGTDQ